MSSLKEKKAAEGKGRSDGAKDSRPGSTWGDLVADQVLSNHYDPPAKPELKPDYDRGYKNPRHK